MTPPNLFVQYPTIPDAPDDPGDDQPLMKTNAASDNSISNVDHIGYNAANGGLHRQVNMFNQSSPTRYGDTVLYSNISAGLSNLWIKTLGADIPLTTYGANGNNNGYTSILGGILVQWGRAVTTGGINSTTSIVFNGGAPAAYAVLGVATPPYIVLISPSSGDSGRIGWATSNKSSTGFDVIKLGSPNFNFDWIAIGPKT